MTKSSLVITDELLMAYADGELEEGLAEQVGQAIDGSPVLAARLKVFHVTGRALAPHFDAVMDSQPPAAMLQAIRSAPMARPADASQKLSLVDSLRRVLQGLGLGSSPWTALAGVAAGLLIGAVATQSIGNGALLAEQDGKLVATGALERTLESASMQASRDESVRIVATFKDETGRWCRLYEGAAHSGLACREGPQHWQVLAAGEGRSSGEDSYVTADGGGAKAVDDLATSMMESSAALDAEAEAALIKSGWKTQ